MKMLLEMDLDTEVELSPVAKAEAAMCSPYSTPSTAVLLQRRVVAWATETGSPATVRVRVGDRSFDLHKDPLVSKCRYFSQALVQSSEVELPASFPGGCESFEVIALFCYGDDVSLDPFNVAAVRCAAEFMDLSDLGARCDLYINQAVLQSWDDALIVLQRCIPLLPAAEDLLVVSRCVESLAFMACMEILDPEQRREHHLASAASLAGRRWDDELVKELAARDLWVKDLIALPLAFFGRIVRALRRQGMREKYVSPVLLFYANKWVLSEKTRKFWAASAGEEEDGGGGGADRRAAAIMQGVVELLPVEAAAPGNAVPVAFYFALLARSLALELSDESRARLRDQVASNLPFARVDDLPLPEQQGTNKLSVADSREVKAVESIVRCYVSKQRRGVDAVAELWDRYLVQIAGDPKLGSERLAELISVVPAGDRKTHDLLYEAINTFLVEHEGLSGEEKATLCGHLDCRKLSHELCIQAVQNDRMPLRLIVQALFVQQLHTHRAFTECSDSFRCVHSGELVPGAAYTPSPAVPTSQPLSASSPRDAKLRARDDASSEYETASFRIQALELEIISLKQTLQRHNTLKGSARRDREGKEPSFRVVAADAAAPAAGIRRRAAVSGSCIGSMRWGSQRRCASRIMRVFARLAVFGRGKYRGKQSKSRAATEQSKGLQK
ncbi:hypothetical protein PR202_gb21450 [Eleusine coracana subsp. coracana]|uniref:NPH3 domain-containing protein n=1 Tax=Eleusine coracana subsp. coracana TaxID=191504 RepID=A0AAV5FD90_ELECO|nr:hypothetical protein QOZ80_7BG0606150 [Eleusine coracana subsp. coracana]GJN32907.1 hypothetical protein PR202_gb21450 [Eleusine coracana subsp. coracana]